MTLMSCSTVRGQTCSEAEPCRKWIMTKVRTDRLG